MHIRGRVKRIATAASVGFAHAASTRSDAAKGEAIVLFTTVPNLAREQLSAAARSLGAPDRAVPRTLIVVAEIPLLGTGKTDYLRLKALTGTPVASAA